MRNLSVSLRSRLRAFYPKTSFQMLVWVVLFLSLILLYLHRSAFFERYTEEEDDEEEDDEEEEEESPRLTPFEEIQILLKSLSSIADKIRKYSEDYTQGNITIDEDKMKDFSLTYKNIIQEGSKKDLSKSLTVDQKKMVGESAMKSIKIVESSFKVLGDGLKSNCVRKKRLS